MSSVRSSPVDRSPMLHLCTYYYVTMLDVNMYIMLYAYNMFCSSVQRRKVFPFFSVFFCRGLVRLHLWVLKALHIYYMFRCDLREFTASVDKMLFASNKNDDTIIVSLFNTHSTYWSIDAFFSKNAPHLNITVSRLSNASFAALNNNIIIINNNMS